ncbi:4-(cytidine 5'-diphospho)-2-C-methyl-D-erythritol kinase [Salipiger sp.]|uniref:4-(cytidine 5'-diphospho)-2-C-methyl-D-erythritol kinase n=1 Tax=Salipiger sp. TaxID=2078585 RepID=UPI003A9850F7
MKRIEVFAPAKINLSLHVTGRRTDGYHLLDSLVVFAPVGDRLILRGADDWSLTVDGPEAEDVPTDGRNLSLAAATLLGDAPRAALSLHKALPPASGIGGGSADAAAALRGMISLANDGTAGGDGAALDRHAPGILALGADIPMCLRSAPARVRGIGEDLSPVNLPPLPAVLVNPRRPVSTPEIFRRLECRDNPPMPDVLPPFPDAVALVAFLAGMRNDLEAPACAAQPAIVEVLAALRKRGVCRLARMSGSGATCFGLFDSNDEAEAAAAAISREHPGWWVAHGALGDMSGRAAPVRQ